jgi:folate-binding protein YgfZ
MPLGPAELLAFSGADALSFAQAQFTSDVSALAPGRWQWSAWLDAQGRVRHFFLLMRAEPERLLAWLPLGGAEAMREALARYVFRAKVALAATTHWNLHAASEDEFDAEVGAQEIVPHRGGYAFRQPAQRIAVVAPSSASAVDAAASDRWRADDVAAALPLLAPALAGEFVPQALGLERLDAIRFDKGCYPGQEIAARLHFRGGNKRTLHRLRAQGVPLAIGEELLDADGAIAGRVLYSAPSSADVAAALAVLPIGTAHDAELRTASGRTVSLSDV